MLSDNVFHLTREDIEATGDDHVLGAVDDEPEAVFVLARDISGAQPAVLECFGGLFGQTPVAARYQWAGDADLARLTLFDRPIVLIEQGGAQERRGRPQLDNRLAS